MIKVVLFILAVNFFWSCGDNEEDLRMMRDSINKVFEKKKFEAKPLTPDELWRYGYEKYLDAEKRGDSAEMKIFMKYKYLSF